MNPNKTAGVRSLSRFGSEATPAQTAKRSTLGHRYLVLSVLALTIAMGGLLTGGTASAVPSAPTDESKVPHYFGPYPNWANSPLALPDAQVVITGNGTTQAKAEATVGANGAITAITVTDGGSGYTPGVHRHHRLRHRRDGEGEHREEGSRRRHHGHRRRERLHGTDRELLRRRGRQRSDRDRLRRRRAGHDHGRRERLHVPDRGLRPAGRPERRPGSAGHAEMDGERDDHGRRHRTTPDRDTRSRRASPSATERCSTRSR